MIRIHIFAFQPSYIVHCTSYIVHRTSYIMFSTDGSCPPMEQVAGLDWICKSPIFLFESTFSLDHYIGRRSFSLQRGEIKGSSAKIHLPEISDSSAINHIFVRLSKFWIALLVFWQSSDLSYTIRSNMTFQNTV